MSDRPLLGAEEEFHVVDLHTRRSTPKVDALLQRLDGPEFAPELQRSLVETNAPVVGSLDELRGHLRRLRDRLADAANPLGLGVVATGTVPLTELTGDVVSAGARYERMTHEYQLLVREQHICGAQVHVDVPDRDVAVQVARRVAPSLPALLAISASSPYWRGVDSGYASYRSLIWSRWPTAGPPAHVETGQDYDLLIAELIASGTISDPGMLYFDVRLVSAADWAGLSAGLSQRVRALEAFLRDGYGERRIVADGVVPAKVVDAAPGLTRLGRLAPADSLIVNSSRSGGAKNTWVLR